MASDSGLVLIAYTGDEVQTFPLPPRGSLSIGRADDNDVALRDASVSRRHCVLHVDGAVRVEDLGGANGTFLSDAGDVTEPGRTRNLRQLSRASAELGVGDRFTVGSTVLVVRRAPEKKQGVGPDVVLRDERMRALYAQADRAAHAHLNVLILGETGVGKEVLARAVHDRSPRAKAAFLGLNCAALSESLLESELFGHERGAFTGAVASRAGLFESADGGTVFLDEIGELPMSMQVKLLRVLEERQVLRVGGRASKPIDVRFIAATNRDLEQRAAEGAFRQDLFFRLNGFALTIPPLRERVVEIEPLARKFAEGVSEMLDRRRPPEIAKETLALLERYAWPGNVRELRNAIERAVVLCDGPTLLPEHLPSRVQAGSNAAAPSSSPHVAPPPAPPSGPKSHTAIQAEIDALERSRIVAALEQCAGNQTRAAEVLGISRRTLATWLERHRIPRPRKREE